MANLIGAAEFKARCLRVISQMNKDRQPVTITKRERPVAVLSPVPAPDESPSIVGAMRGSGACLPRSIPASGRSLRLVRRRMIVLDTNGSWSYQKYLTT